MAVLILTKNNEPHSRAVAAAIGSLGGRCEVVDIDSLRTAGSITLDISPSTALQLGQSGFAADYFSAVFVHSAIPTLSTFEGSDEIDRMLVRSTWRSLVSQVSTCLAGARWVNHPHAARNAANLQTQFAIASKAGLQTPATIITNDHDRAVAFARQFKAVVLKTGPLPDCHLPEGQVLYTHRFTAQELDDKRIRQSFTGTPSVIQEFVSKAYDLRVYVIADSVFACKIESQHATQTEVDWRRYNLALTPHVPVQLSKSIQTTCRSLTSALGLVFASIDFAVTENEELFFLEANPSSAWLWIERLTGLPITQTLAMTLLQGSPARSFRDAEEGGVSLGHLPRASALRTKSECTVAPSVISTDQLVSLRSQRFGEAIWDRLPAEVGLAGLISAPDLTPDEVLDLFVEHGNNSEHFTSFKFDPESQEAARYQVRMAVSEAEGARERIAELSRTRTLVIRCANCFLEGVELARARLERYFGCTVTSSLYYSSQGAPSFPSHSDTHHVVAVQAFGSKVWRLWSPSIFHPFTAKTFPLELLGPPVGLWTLEAGMALYIPWGWPHEAVADASGSIHVSFGIFPPTRASLLEQRLRTATASRPSLRKSLDFVFDPTTGFHY